MFTVNTITRNQTTLAVVLLKCLQCSSVFIAQDSLFPFFSDMKNCFVRCKYYSNTFLNVVQITVQPFGCNSVAVGCSTYEYLQCSSFFLCSASLFSSDMEDYYDDKNDGERKRERDSVSFIFIFL